MREYTYGGDRLLPAALGVLDEEDLRVAAALIHSDDAVAIDWPQLEATMLSSTERFRVELARSLLDGTQVSLQQLVHCGSGTYGLILRSLSRSWPDAPPDFDLPRR